MGSRRKKLQIGDTLHGYCDKVLKTMPKLETMWERYLGQIGIGKIGYNECQDKETGAL